MDITARQIVTRALRRIGALASGETPSAAEAKDALDLLNELLDAWNGEQLMLPAVVSSGYTLIPGQQTYTLGEGAEFDGIRPTELLDARVQRTDGPFWRPVAILSRQRWQRESWPDLTAEVPYAAIYQDTVPYGTLSVFPVPTTPATLRLWHEQPLESFPDLDTEISMQEGYARCLRLNLALTLAGEWGKPIDDLLVPEATESKASLKRRNEDVPELGVDAMYHPGAGFDIQTGGF